MTPQPLAPTSPPSERLPPTPSNSETRVDQRDKPLAPDSEPNVGGLNGLVIPDWHWSLVDACEASADTVIISTTPLLTPAIETS